MKIEITKDGNLVLDLRELVKSMSNETRNEFLKSLCADETLFDAVVDQLATGVYFEDWWFDSRTVTAWRAKLVELMPEVTRQLVRHLIFQRDSAEAEKERLNTWAYKLYHAWPDEYWTRRPDRPQWESPGFPSEAKLDAVLAGTEKP